MPRCNGTFRSSSVVVLSEVPKFRFDYRDCPRNCATKQPADYIIRSESDRVSFCGNLPGSRVWPSTHRVHGRASPLFTEQVEADKIGEPSDATCKPTRMCFLGLACSLRRSFGYIPTRRQETPHTCCASSHLLQ